MGSVLVGLIPCVWTSCSDTCLQRQCLPEWKFRCPVNCSSTPVHSCLCRPLAAISPLALFLNDVKLELYESGWCLLCRGVVGSSSVCFCLTVLGTEFRAPSDCSTYLDPVFTLCYTTQTGLEPQSATQSQYYRALPPGLHLSLVVVALCI